MNKYILIILMLITVLSACEKDDNESIALDCLASEYNMRLLNELPEGIKPMTFQSLEALERYLDSRKVWQSEVDSSATIIVEELVNGKLKYGSGSYHIVSYIRPPFYWFNRLEVTLTGSRNHDPIIKSRIVGFTYGVSYKHDYSTFYPHNPSDILTGFSFTIYGLEYYEVPTIGTFIENPITINGIAFPNNGSVVMNFN